MLKGWALSCHYLSNLFVIGITHVITLFVEIALLVDAEDFSKVSLVAASEWVYKIWSNSHDIQLVLHGMFKYRILCCLYACVL